MCFTHLIALFTSTEFCFVSWGLSSVLDVSSAQRPEVVTHLLLSKVNNKVVLENCHTDKRAEPRVQYCNLEVPSGQKSMLYTFIFVFFELRIHCCQQGYFTH